MLSFKSFYGQYLTNTHTLERWQRLSVFFLIVVYAGIIGWLYEFIFYYFNGGMTQWYLQGGNFLPWINIYAIGSLLVIALTRKLKKHPALVALISAIATGILEYVSGWGIYMFLDGTRFWDYNTEIWNWGNIGGFVCLRSVLVFTIGSLLLMYLLLPTLEYLTTRIKKEILLTISIILFSLFMCDEIYNLLIVRLFDIPSAIDIYRSAGFHYVP